MSELAAALSKFQGEIPKVTKTKTGEVTGTTKDGRPYAYKYGYADLGDVVAQAYPIMAKYGLAFSAKPTLNEGGHFVLAYKLTHESGESEAGEYPLPATGSPQQIGSAITYARRYTFTAVLGIVSEEDDDGKAAPQEQAPTSRAPRKRAAKTAEPDEDAMRKKYHVLREKLGWDEQAGHDHIEELSKGLIATWHELNVTQKGAVLSSMEDLVEGLGPNFPNRAPDNTGHGADAYVDTDTGEVR